MSLQPPVHLAARTDVPRVHHLRRVIDGEDQPVAADSGRAAPGQVRERLRVRPYGSTKIWSIRLAIRFWSSRARRFT